MIHALILADREVEPRRSEPRHDLDTPVALRPFGSEGEHARLLNLSSRGFMAETQALVAPGTRVWLNLPGRLRASAVVVWARNGRIGGEFAEPVDVLRVFDAAGRRL